MLSNGYVIEVEAWFGDIDKDGTIYDKYCDMTSEDRDGKSAFTEIDYLNTGYDYIHFSTKTHAKKFYKRLVEIGVPDNQIVIWHTTPTLL